MQLKLSDAEEALVKDWQTRHDAECTLRKTPLGRAGSLGERFTYEVTPCAMGMYSAVVCGCGAKLQYLDSDGEGYPMHKTETPPAPKKA